MVRRYYSGVAGERVMATLRTDISDRYRDLALQYHRETPTGELLAHMEADVKAAVDVFWPVPVRDRRHRCWWCWRWSQLFRTDVWLALIGLVLFPSLALMNRSFAQAHGGSGTTGAGEDRRRLRGGARVDRRRPGGEDPGPRGRRRPTRLAEQAERAA